MTDAIKNIFSSKTLPAMSITASDVHYIASRDWVNKFKSYIENANKIQESLSTQIDTILNTFRDDSKGRIVIISGMPGSGKTDIARALQGLKRPFKHIQIGENQINNHQELLERIIKETTRKSKTRLVINGTLLGNMAIESIVDAVKYAGIETHVIVVDVPMEYAYFNNVKRSEKTGSNYNMLPLQKYERLDIMNHLTPMDNVIMHRVQHDANIM